MIKSIVELVFIAISRFWFVHNKLEARVTLKYLQDVEGDNVWPDKKYQLKRGSSY